MGVDHIIGNIEEVEDNITEVGISNLNIDIDNDINKGGKIISDEVCQLISDKPEIRINTEIQNPIISGPIEKIKSSINKLLDFEYKKMKFQFKNQEKKSFARKATMSVVEYDKIVIKCLKKHGFLSKNTQEGELLGRLFNGYTTKKGNIIDSVLIKENISETIKSYYRKKALESFEKFTQFIGIKAILRISYNTENNAKIIFNTIEQDMLYINGKDLVTEYTVSKEELGDIYLDAFASLSKEEIIYLAIGYRELAISFNFNACINHIKITFVDIGKLLNNTAHENRDTLKNAIKKQLNELGS